MSPRKSTSHRELHLRDPQSSAVRQKSSTRQAHGPRKPAPRRVLVPAPAGRHAITEDRRSGTAPRGTRQPLGLAGGLVPGQLGHRAQWGGPAVKPGASASTRHRARLCGAARALCGTAVRRPEQPRAEKPEASGSVEGKRASPRLVRDSGAAGQAAPLNQGRKERSSVGWGGGRRAGAPCGAGAAGSAGSEASAEEVQGFLLWTLVTLFGKTSACLRYPRHKDHPGRVCAGSVPELVGSRWAWSGPNTQALPPGSAEGLSPTAWAPLRNQQQELASRTTVSPISVSGVGSADGTYPQGW